MQLGSRGGEGVRARVYLRVCVCVVFREVVVVMGWGVVEKGWRGGGLARGCYEYDPRDIPLWAHVRFWGHLIASPPVALMCLLVRHSESSGLSAVILPLAVSSTVCLSVCLSGCLPYHTPLLMHLHYRKQAVRAREHLILFIITKPFP